MGPGREARCASRPGPHGAPPGRKLHLRPGGAPWGPFFRIAEKRPPFYFSCFVFHSSSDTNSAIRSIPRLILPEEVA